MEIDYHEGNAHTPHVIALNRNWKKEITRRKRGATNQTDPGTPSQSIWYSLEDSPQIARTDAGAEAESHEITRHF